MSKSSTATTPKTLPKQSAWSKGPPLATIAPSSRSQSPAPSTPTHATHSRRPSTLGQGIAIKDGVSVPRNNIGSVKQGSSSVTFGSIDDTSNPTPMSSSPATAPTLKTEVKSFGSVPAVPVNGKPAVQTRQTLGPPPTPSTTTASSSTPSTPPVSTPSTPAPKPSHLGRADITKLFQNPSSAPSSHPSSDNSSPAQRTAPLPPATQPPPSQPSQLGAHPFTPFVPPSMRAPQSSGGAPPRSPSYPRAMANGAPPRSQPGPNGAPAQVNAAMGSPRLAPPPHGQPSPMPPQPTPMPNAMPPGPAMWGQPYYYDQSYMYPPQWYHVPHQAPPPHAPPGAPHPPHTMTMSPRTQAPPLPGTPTQSHAQAHIPPMPHAPHAPHPPPHSHGQPPTMPSITSPPPTPSSATGPSSRLSATSSTFIPAARKPVVLKNADGAEVSVEALKQNASAAISSYRPGSANSHTQNRRSANIRLESEEQKKARLAEEEAKEKAKQEAEDKARKDKEEKERLEREATAKKRKEEEEKEKERLRKEEEKEKERLRKEQAEKERLRKEAEEKERQKQEAEEKERIRKEQEEKERIRLEEERKRNEEKERQRKAEEEAAKEVERLRLEAEEQERKRLAEEAAAAEAALKAKAEAEAAARAKADTEAAAEAVKPAEDEQEEGEIVETQEEQAAAAAPTDDTKDKVKENLRINTSLESRKRPGALDLSLIKGPISAPLGSALLTARNIDDINSVAYPEGISSPHPELNKNATDGRFRYDRDFLLQFMSHCKERPPTLPALDAIGLEPNDQAALAMTRTSSGRRPQPGTASRQASVGLGFGPGFKAQSNPFGGGMGSFSTGKTSEERFQAATAARSSSVSGSSLNFARPSPMQRTPSQGGVGGPPMHSTGRTRSKRGDKRPDMNKMPQQSHGPTFSGTPSNQLIPLESVVPLQFTANRWDRKQFQVMDESPELVERKVKGLLNKLTMEKFDSISDQIIEWANRSEKENDGRTLIQVIKLVFEKATDEATWSEMYARLCRKMMEQISNKVQDDGIKNSDGKPITGGNLFRKYLLNRCQEDFERGWVAKEATAAAAATKSAQDKAVKDANDKKEGDDEVALYSEEYYAAQKAKRQGLGLIKFIGELFKLSMLTERIMHECIKKLLGNVDDPEEEEIESLCKLLATVGHLLDTPKAKQHMDVYFGRMKDLSRNLNINNRMQFMLQDVIELRDRKWILRTAVAAPTTIAAVHEQAAKEKANFDKDTLQRLSMSRGGSRRGVERGAEVPQVAGSEGWSVAGGGATKVPARAGDLSNFGKISKTTPTTFGPSSIFSGKKEGKRDAISRTSSSSNMFSMLSQAEAASEPKAEPPQRRKLVLAPRSKPAEEPSAEPVRAESPAESGPAPTMSDDAAKHKIDEDVKEYFAVQNLEEAENYFTSLPPAHHGLLVEKLVGRALESKESDAKLVASLFELAAKKELCNPEAFEAGFTPLAEVIDDIVIDAPKALDLFAIMLKGARLDSERQSKLAGFSMDSDKLLALLS